MEDYFNTLCKLCEETRAKVRYEFMNNFENKHYKIKVICQKTKDAH